MDFTDKAGSINELLAKPGNGQCADCQKRLDLENAWGVLRYGVLVCQDCKLVHIALESQRKQNEDPGILSCAKSQVWTGDDFTKFLHNGNDRTNKRLLSAFPVWAYQPTPNDSISLKEQWISQKYRERSAAENELLKQPPKNAGTLCPVQFCRKAKSGNEPCAAVLHKEELYLTSEKRKEVIAIVDVETALLTQDNGIMLAYRDQDSTGTDEFRFAHLNHEDQHVVLEWVNTLLYMKFKLLKEQHPNVADQELGKLLNRYVIRQSYVTAGSNPIDQLLFFVLSESRLAVFEHHLDEKPRYQTRIYQNHLTSVQYLTQVGNVLNIQVEKVYGYDEWLQALDQALHNERLCSLPERLKAPSPLECGMSGVGMEGVVTAISSIHLNTTSSHVSLSQHQQQQQQQQAVVSSVAPIGIVKQQTKVPQQMHASTQQQQQQPQPHSQQVAQIVPKQQQQQQQQRAIGNMSQMYQMQKQPQMHNVSVSNSMASSPNLRVVGATQQQQQQQPPQQQQQQQHPPQPPTSTTNQMTSQLQKVNTDQTSSSNHHQQQQQQPTRPIQQQEQASSNSMNSQNGQKEIGPKGDWPVCYPAIGPMGEMGKVFRGELPAEAIRPPPPKPAQFNLNPGTIQSDQESTIMATFENERRKNDTNQFQFANCYPPIGPTGIPGVRPGAPPPNINSPGMGPPPPMGPPAPPNMMPPMGRNPSVGGGMPPMMDKNDFNPNDFNPGFTGANDPSTQYRDMGRRPSFQPPGPPPSRPDGWSHPMPPPNNRFNYDTAPNRLQPSGWPSDRQVTGPPPFDRSIDRSISCPTGGPTNRSNWGIHNRQPAPTPSPPSHDAWSKPRSSISNSDWGTQMNNRHQPRPSVGSDSWNSQPPENVRRSSSTPDIWRRAEDTIDHLIINGLVPASDMQSAHIDPNMKDHAQFCAEELYTAVKDQKYEMALSFLRGFRDVFAASTDPEIRHLFVSAGELATLKTIVLMRYRHLMQNQGQDRNRDPDRNPPRNPPPSGPWSSTSPASWGRDQNPQFPTSNSNGFQRDLKFDPREPWSTSDGGASQNPLPNLYNIADAPRISPDPSNGSSNSDSNSLWPTLNKPSSYRVPSSSSALSNGVVVGRSCSESAYSPFQPVGPGSNNSGSNNANFEPNRKSLSSHRNSISQIWDDTRDTNPGWNIPPTSAPSNSTRLPRNDDLFSTIWQRDRSPDLAFNSADSLIFQTRIEDNINQLVSTDTL